jgi:hypothetical protein
MRKIDKKLNLKKVNVLFEQRYIKNKRLITENLADDIEYVKLEFKKLIEFFRKSNGEFENKENDIIKYTGKPKDGTYIPGLADGFYWSESALYYIDYIDKIKIEGGELKVPYSIAKQGYESDLIKKYDEVKDLDMVKLQYLLYRLERSWFHFTSTDSTTHGLGEFLFTTKYSYGECSCEVNIHNKFKNMVKNWVMNEYKPKYETLKNYISSKIK